MTAYSERVLEYFRDPFNVGDFHDFDGLGKAGKPAKTSHRDTADSLGGLPPMKMQCSVLAKEEYTKAIEDCRTGRNGSGQ